MRDALCKKHPEISFFPTRCASSAPAKAICRRCAVSSECLACALAIGYRVDGIWGGTTQGERQVILRRRLDQRSCHGSTRPYTDEEIGELRDARVIGDLPANL